MKYTSELHERVRKNLRMFDYPRFDDGDIDALLDEIDRLQAERRWIPVSEPPNTDGLYLASLDNGGVEIVEYWLGGWMMKLDEDWTRTELPTHWMPLPASPESKE